MKKQKFNYFYRIENKINGNFYYGVHKTDNLEDGYMGSGLRLQRAFKKYGVENFDKKIIAFFNTYEEALNMESEIVTEQLVLDNKCYNLKRGGNGGFERNISIIGASNRAKKLWKNPEYIKMMRQLASKTLKKLIKEGIIERCNWTGRKHKEESKRLIGEKNSIYQKGEGNSQYGTCWITNGKENKKIHKGDLIPDDWRLGRKIK